MNHNAHRVREGDEKDTDGKQFIVGKIERLESWEAWKSVQCSQLAQFTSHSLHCASLASNTKRTYTSLWARLSAMTLTQGAKQFNKPVIPFSAICMSHCHTQ